MEFSELDDNRNKSKLMLTNVNRKPKYDQTPETQNPFSAKLELIGNNEYIAPHTHTHAPTVPHTHLHTNVHTCIALSFVSTE